MSRANVEALIVIIATVGVFAIFSEHEWRPVVESYFAPEAIPFQEAMQCPTWTEGKSRTLVVFADEDDEGSVTNIRCVRMAGRGRM